VSGVHPRAPAASKPLLEWGPARARRARARRKRWFRRAIRLGAGMIIVGLLVWGAVFSPLFTVRSVRVTGESMVSASELTRIAAIPPDRSLFRLDITAIRSRVAAVPEVARVVVRRRWPASVQIDVTERSAVAVIHEGDRRYRLVDQFGVAFRWVRSAPAGTPVIAADSAGSGPRRWAAPARVLGALTGTTLLRWVAVAWAEASDDVTLRLRDGRRVRWGSVDASARKAAVLVALLRSPQSRGAVYDVSAPDAPTVR
jgi:cell division protein FtsQ